jgi:hypothetical protein
MWPAFRRGQALVNDPTRKSWRLMTLYRGNQFQDGILIPNATNPDT